MYLRLSFVVNVLELILPHSPLIDQIVQIDHVHHLAVRAAFTGGRGLTMGKLFFLVGFFVDEFGIELDSHESHVHNVFFGLKVGLGAEAILVLDAAISFDVDENFILLDFALLEHVPPELCEPELDPVFEEAGGWLEDGGCLVKIPLTLLEVEFDVAVYSIVPQVS